MTTSDNVSLALARALFNNGYHKYATVQYIWNNETADYDRYEFSLEKCAMNEIQSGKQFIYAPTLDEAWTWITEQQPEWNVAVLWDNNMKGFYFIVQNIKTGYEYKQPPTPNELNSFRMYEWAMEHVLNRFNSEY